MGGVERFGLFVESVAELKYVVRSAASFSRFSSIVVFTQHLAVGRIGFPALVPRVNVISFHFVQLKLVIALDADSLLSLVRLALHVVGECSNV